MIKTYDTPQSLSIGARIISMTGEEVNISTPRNLLAVSWQKGVKESSQEASGAKLEIVAKVMIPYSMTFTPDVVESALGKKLEACTLQELVDFAESKRDQKAEQDFYANSTTGGVLPEIFAPRGGPR